MLNGALWDNFSNFSSNLNFSASRELNIFFAVRLYEIPGSLTPEIVEDSNVELRGVPYTDKK